jgi:hypothetical protein
MKPFLCSVCSSPLLLSSFLVSAGARPKGFSLLHAACGEMSKKEEEYLEYCKYLVDNFKVDPNIRDEYGRTPLFYALYTNKKLVCELLLSRGADPFTEDWAGETPISYARKMKKSNRDGEAALIGSVLSVLGLVNSNDDSENNRINDAISPPKEVDVDGSKSVGSSAFASPEKYCEGFGLSKLVFYVSESKRGGYMRRLHDLEREVKHGSQLDDAFSNVFQGIFGTFFPDQSFVDSLFKDAIDGVVVAISPISKVVEKELKKLLCRFDIACDGQIESPIKIVCGPEGEGKIVRRFIGESPQRLVTMYVVMYSFPDSTVGEDEGISEYNRRGTFSKPAPIIRSEVLRNALPGNFYTELPLETLLSQTLPPKAGYLPVFALGPFTNKEDADKAKKEWKDQNMKGGWKNGVFDLSVMTANGKTVADSLNIHHHKIKAFHDDGRVKERKVDKESIEVSFRKMNEGDSLKAWPGSPFKPNCVENNSITLNIARKDTPMLWSRKRGVSSSSKASGVSVASMEGAARPPRPPTAATITATAAATNAAVSPPVLPFTGVIPGSPISNNPQRHISFNEADM